MISQFLGELNRQFKIREYIFNEYTQHSTAKDVCISMMYANKHFLNCCYGPIIDTLLLSFPSPSSIAKILDLQLHDDDVKEKVIFDIGDTPQDKLGMGSSLLHEFCQFAKIDLNLDFSATEGGVECVIFLENAEVARERGISRKVAKHIASISALRHPILSDHNIADWFANRNIKPDLNEAISRSSLTGPSINWIDVMKKENPYGFRIMKKYGWDGGSLGKRQSNHSENFAQLILDNLDLSYSAGKFGLGHPLRNAVELKEQKIVSKFMEFLDSPTQKQLVFDGSLEKNERAFIHIVAQKYGLRHKSVNTSSARHLIISKIT